MCVSFADYIHILAQKDFLFTTKALLNHRTIRWFCNTKNDEVSHSSFKSVKYDFKRIDYAKMRINAITRRCSG